jgi:hypothetical protein
VVVQGRTSCFYLRRKGNKGEIGKQESGEHMVKCVSTTLSENRRSKQLFVHVGAHIIPPFTTTALASLPTNTSIGTPMTALCFVFESVLSLSFSALLSVGGHNGHPTEWW